MNTDKYYTPTIEEFHVGFEFEFRQMRYNFEGDVNEDVESNMWVSEKVFKEDLTEDPERNRNFGHNDWFNVFRFPIRVKYLDKEDIENLGFEVMGGQMISGGRIDCQKEYKDPRGVYDKAMLTFTPSKNWVIIAVGDDETSFHDWNTLFAGTIKNKSELRRLLKQLGI